MTAKDVAGDPLVEDTPSGAGTRRPAGPSNGRAADPDPEVVAELVDSDPERSDEPAGAGATPREHSADDEAVSGLGLAELGLLQAERDEYLDALRRLQADFDNYRKRTARQQSELLERSTESLIGRLLPVLDAFDLALAHAQQPQAGFDSGEPSKSEDVGAFARIASLLRDTLAKEGLEPIGTVGEAFDPTVHDAVAHVADDDSDESKAAPGGVVNEMMRAGYRLKGKVLRPAMVQVRG